MPPEPFLTAREAGVLGTIFGGFLHPLAECHQGVEILQADVHALADVLLQMAGHVPGCHSQGAAVFFVEGQIFFGFCGRGVLILGGAGRTLP